MENGGDERLKRRAYELWEMEGRPEGKDKEHWSRAESEPNEKRAGDEEGTQGSEASMTRRKKTVRQSASGDPGSEKTTETHTTTRHQNG